MSPLFRPTLAAMRLGTRIASERSVIDSGTVLQGRFLIEDKIGVGGMGAVYRAVDQKFGSLVAIKETFYGDTNLAEAFEREARLLNGLHHAILPHVSDYFTENGGHFLVMEYIEGEDLSEIIKRGEVVPVSTVLGWALDLLDGLDYLHSQDPPVVHRDIKPNNLKLTSRGKLMLLDFGMAKETSSNTLGAQSVFGYSRRYSPLEQIEGTGTDERSDIFSLGASIYHLITGKAAVDVLARASAIVAGRPDPMVPANAINPEVPENVAAILSTALSLNAEHRFESARAMSNALEHVIKSSSIAEQARQDGKVIPVAASAVMPASGAAPIPVSVDEPKFEEEIDITKPVPFDSLPDPKDTSSTSDNVRAASPARGFLPAAGNTIRSTATTAPSGIRVRKPAGANYAVWLSVLVLLIAFVLEAAYRNVPSAGNESTDTAGVTATEGAEAIDQAASSSETGEPREDVVASKTEAPLATGHADQRRGPVGRQADSQSGSGEESAAKGDEAVPAPVRRAERRGQTQNATDRSARRAVRPAFEQPSVSSIEMIMTGLPYEGGRRADDEDELTEDELRERRRIRRAMRRNAPPF